MSTKKPKSTPAQFPRHFFRMKAGGTEFEAHGLGLIVAALTVIVLLAALFFGATASRGVAVFFDSSTQSEPLPLERPPPT